MRQWGGGCWEKEEKSKGKKEKKIREGMKDGEMGRRKKMKEERKER